MNINIPEKMLAGLVPLYSRSRKYHMLQFKRFTESVHHQKHKTTDLNTNSIDILGNCFTSVKKI